MNNKHVFYFYSNLDSTCFKNFKYEVIEPPANIAKHTVIIIAKQATIMLDEEFWIIAAIFAKNPFPGPIGYIEPLRH